MTSAEQTVGERIPTRDLSDVELQVLTTLEEARRPLDAIEVASASLLDVDDVLDALRRLKEKGVIQEKPPEPIRERFRADEDALQKVAG